MPISTLNGIAWTALSTFKGVAKATISTINGVSVPSSASYLISEDFETLGTPTGWTGSGTPQWNYNTSPAPLLGSYSAQFAAAESDTGYASFTDQSSVWFRLMFNVNALTSSPYICYLRNATTDLVYLRLLSTGYIRAYNGDGTTIGTGSTTLLSAGSTYYIWVRYKRGTGANAEVDCYVSSNNTRPGSKEITSTSAKGAADANRLHFNPVVTSSVLIIDNVLVSTSEIGSGALP